MFRLSEKQKIFARIVGAGMIPPFTAYLLTSENLMSALLGLGLAIALIILSLG